MSKLSDWFKPKFKIMPTYSAEKMINGYIPIKKNIVGYYPMTMLQQTENGKYEEVMAIFPNYKNAMDFLKHATKIISYEEISSPKND